MAHKKQPFDLILSKQAATGTNDVRSAPVPENQLHCYQHVTVENESHAFTDLRIMKAGRGGEFLLQEQDSPQAATLYWMTDNVYLAEGQQLVVRFTGCTADDKLRVYGCGWKQEGKELDA
jgi:hypothetical protein